jgi:hypothetical protein
MTALKRRDRVLLFRLTEDEYSNLQAASAERGARNLSDFARTELLGVVDSTQQESALDGRLSSVEQKLSDMHSVIEKMNSLLEGIASRKTKS